MPKLEAQTIVKAFGGDTVVDRLSLEVSGGEILCIRGATGSGKTTLLRIIAGLEQPDDGNVVIDGRELAANTPPAERNIAMVFQNRALWPHMTVARHLDLVLRSLIRDRAARQDRVDATLERCKLTALAKEKVDRLSGGQQQQVAIARALAVDAPILLLDEPLNHLDDDLRIHFMGVFLEEKRAGKAILLTTHRAEEADALADRTMTMDGDLL